MKLARGLILPVLLVLLFESLWRILALRSEALAPPSAIGIAFIGAVQDGTLLQASIETIGSAAIGLVVGGLIGTIGGIALGFSAWLARCSFLTVEAMRAIPAIALMPLVMLVYGFGYRTEITIIAFATVWPTLLIAQQAVRGITREQIELAHLLQLGRAKTLVAIVLPAITPRLFTAFRLSASLALVVAVTVEIFGNPQGLGYAIAISEQNLDPAQSLAMLLWVGVFGYFLNLLLVAGQNRLFLQQRDVAVP